MAYDSEDIRIRQHRRQQEQQRRQANRQRQRRRMTMSLIAAGVVLALCGLVILVVNLANKPDNSRTTTNPTAVTPEDRETVITISFGGDLNVTDKVVNAGISEGGYDYTDTFMDVVPLLAGANASVINLEGNVCGSPYGTASTSAPPELLDALSAAGVDLIQMANSSAINNGLLGLRNTLTAIRKANMQTVGAYATTEDANESKGFTLCSIHGVKVAFVSFTKGMSKGKESMYLPSGSEGCINLLYTDRTYQDIDTEGIQKILRDVEKEKPDVTIALLHWGSEYNDQVSASQIRIQKLMKKEGVDAIIGTHSHYVQKIDYDSKDGSLVAWSLGDFFGDGTESGTHYSIVLNLEITKDNQTGKTKITGFDYEPIYTMTEQRDGVTANKLLRIREAIAAYEADAIGKVSEQTYTAMKSTLAKIESRIDPE